jgi:2-(1,2-epoxy-1,2-dihydrophenyl)acetyl-CoA isomerase
VTDPNSDDSLLAARDGGVLTLTLNRPKRKNAMDPPLAQAIAGALRAAREDASVRVVVLTGAGGDFCSGADLGAEQSESHWSSRMRLFNDVGLALHELPQPTMAKVDGVAAGAGLNVALACDLVVASDRARFSEIFVKRGLSLDLGGSWLLPRRVGLHKAKELALLGDFVDAAEAERIGLVNKVVPVEELEAAVADWTSRLAAGPPIAMAQTKAMLDNAFALTYPQALADEARAQIVNFGTKDTPEAILAFLQKREPEFEGR